MDIKRLFDRKSNTLQAIWAALGNMASFAVTLVTSMILSRYFNKEDYGTYKQVMYIYNTLLVVFILGLPQAFGYFLPRAKLEQGRDIVWKITSMFFVAGFIYSSFLFMASTPISLFMNNGNLSYAIKLFSPVPFFMLPTMGLESIYSTYRKTYISAIYSIFSRIMMILFVVIPIIIWGGDYKSAIVGFVLSSFFVFCIALYLIFQPFKNLKREKSDISRMTILKFSFPLMIGGLWSLVLNSTDQFFISRYFGTRIFAEFSNGSIELPFVGMIIGACTTVLYPLFSKMNKDGLNPREAIFPLWESVAKKTAMIIYPLLAFCWVYATELMVVLYGDSYEISAVYFRIKLVLNIFTLIAFTPIILSIGKTKYFANVHMFAAISLVILEFVSVKTFASPYMITSISVLCQLGKICALLAVVSNYFKVSFIELFPIREGVLIIPVSVMLVCIIKYLTNCYFPPLLSLVLGFVLYITIFGFYSLFVGLKYRNLLRIG